MSLIIYSAKKSPRLEYVLQILFQGLGGIDYQWVVNKEDFEKSSLPKINYSFSRISKNELFLIPNELLFEEGIKFQSITVFSHKNLPAFFFTSSQADLPFDFFALTFYLISRYEEYLPFRRDNHNRFSAKESLAFQHKFLQLPLINLWTQYLQKKITKKYPQIRFNPPKYIFQPTYDIDFAWSYCHKGLKRSVGGYLRDLMNLDFPTISERFLVQINRQRDPFFSFDYLNELHQKYNLQPIWFFLLGDYSTFDKNTPVSNHTFQELIQSITNKNETGIHPSYLSNNHISILKMEKERLENITQTAVLKSRQHFLKLSFPTTYQNLIKIGIQSDFSMGYAAKMGFRASIATPFLWYDLANEKATSLKVYPFQLMDVTLQQYLKYSREEAIGKSLEMIKITKEVGGTFISLWHNSSFSTEEKWQGWSDVYEAIIAAACK